MTDIAAAKSSSDREIVFSRVFDAPRELVWQAMTDPRHVVHWWGPLGFTTTIEEMDVRPGGVWNHVMHGPDGVDYPNRSVFKEIVEAQRIVYSHGGAKKGGPEAEFEATWTFEAMNGGSKTKLTVRMVFPSAAARDLVVKEYGAIEGGKQTLQRLAEHLPRMDPAAGDFVINRILDAPRALVFQAWTEPKHMAQWWGPHQFTNPVCEMDVRPGGAFRIVMRGPDGAMHPAKGAYREIVAPERLVMTIDHSELSDEWHDRVNPKRDRAAGKPKVEAVVTVTFEEQGGKTKLTISLRFESAAVRDAMVNLGMAQGWAQSLERLEKLLGVAK